MVSFVHIADKNDEQSIVKNGIRAAKGFPEAGGVYAVPVVPNYTTTHQWARELKRRGVRTLICVQFKSPNDELVWVGKYASHKLQMTASAAAAAVMKHTDPMGLEVIIPRKIRPGEITRTYLAPRITGWRYFPTAKGKKPCRCRICLRGDIRAQRLMPKEE